MDNKKQFFSIILLIAGIMLSSAVIGKGKQFKNLKVLPKDITEARLDSIMDSYNKALKVSCDFCHVQVKGTKSDQSDSYLDFAADIAMKENARKMIHLQIDINKKYFYYDKNIKPEYLNAVSCNTCHRGNPFPLGE